MALTLAPPAARSNGATQSGPLITVTRVNKTYSTGVVALDDISFAVQQGEFVSLVGPSGCGKSTLLRIIAGLGAISEGEVLVEGMPPKQTRQEHSEARYAKRASASV